MSTHPIAAPRTAVSASTVATLLTLVLGPLAAISVAPTAVHAQSRSTLPTNDAVQEILNDRIERTGIPGIVVGITGPEGTRVISAGRVAGVGTDPPDAGTFFEIGSVAKVLTSLLLAEMVARGEVALNEPITDFLPDDLPLPASESPEITLIDLVTHTSGLPPLPTNFAPADMSDPYADYTEARLHEFLRTYRAAPTPAEANDRGHEYAYSNLGFGLLGYLLSLRAGLPYEELVTERILDPLGMEETVMRVAPMMPRLATGHGPDLEPASPWRWDVLAGAGAWHSTVEELLRLLEAAMTPPPGPLGQAFTASIEPRRSVGVPNLRIGLGWHLLETGERTLIWHNGQTGGFRAFVGFDPASGSGVVVLANASIDMDDIGLHILEPGIPLRELAPLRHEIMLDEETLARYVGRYELTADFAIDIILEDGRLFARATDQDPLRLHPESETLFFLRAVEAEIEFTLDDAGRVTGLVLHQGGMSTPGRRVPGG